MKVTLICPKWENRGLSTVSFFFSVPFQSLVQLASLTPLDWEVEIVDENIVDVNFDKPTDLVGLTAMTALAPRAYEISAEFRSRGVKTVMGGIHASMLPSEASKHVDSVVIGEADEIWTNILDDFKHGKLKQVYKSTSPASLDIPTHRRVARTYPTSVSRRIPFSLKCAYIQAQRGCPHGCEFCSVTKFNGKRIRAKSISYLLKEIEQEMENGFKFLIFTDDNIVANKRYAKELFKELRHLKIRWLSQTDIRIADDDIIDLACESGLVGAFLGLDSISSSTLRGSVSDYKHRLRSSYEDAIGRLHSYGVWVETSFIFGFDEDRRDAIETTVEWAVKNKVGIAQLSILTPFPGTVLYAKMAKEGRLLTRDWACYNFFNCVFKPTGWSKKELEEELRQAYKKFYSLSSIARRAGGFPPSLLAVGSLFTNLEFRRFRQ